MQTDPLGDFLTMIRNASLAAKTEIITASSRMKREVARVLQAEGYLSEVEEIKEDPKKPRLRVLLRQKGRKRVITHIKRISKPGLRRYVHSDEIPKVLQGMGVSILSTSQGIMPGHVAKKRRLGGELLLEVY